MALGTADFRRIVTTAGTRVPLAVTSTGFRTVTITAETDNTGIVVVGAAATVVAAVLTRTGIPLNPGDTVTISKVSDGIGDLASLGLDSMVSGDGVTGLYTGVL